MKTKVVKSPEVKRKLNQNSWGHVALLFLIPLARVVPSSLYWYVVGIWLVAHVALRIRSHTLKKLDAKNHKYENEP